MEKIISINFHGRLIPIEESAYDELKKYIDGLRRHFANEESSEEIIQDIENRIAELFSERLKNGATCITASDMQAVINSIGKLEDIEAAEGDENYESGTGNSGIPPQQKKGRLYRDADGRVIAGVCSGIAARLGMDPIVVRVLFVLLFGALFGLYILLWIIVPSQSNISSVTRRLYRNPNDRYIAGVCGGLSVYFGVETWIPRLIFALPLLVSMLSGSAHAMWWPMHWGLGGSLFAGSIGGSLFVLYIVLWIALPYASSSTDMLEMRGEKIDINSIKAATLEKAGNAGTYTTRTRSGLGRALGILFKAFFLFIAGAMAVGLFCVLIALFLAGAVAFPFTDLLLTGYKEHLLLWSGVSLFFGIPLLALVTWLIRRMIGVRSHRHYLSYIFAGLWIIGIINIFATIGIFTTNFRHKAAIDEMYMINQPSGNSMYISIGNAGSHATRHLRSSWYNDWNDHDDMPFYLVDDNTLFLNTVKINVTRSQDTAYHVYEARMSRGTTTSEAKEKANKINFRIEQQDSIIVLPDGFTVSASDKFRNQQVVLTIAVPMGKTIQFSPEVDRYKWFNINFNGRRNMHIDNNCDSEDFSENGVYLMTENGLLNTNDPSDVIETEIDE
jgi:phage shock protein PspC (stress-responsive transcriptional regulator)